MLWLLAAVDLAGGTYLLAWALRRERRDRPAVLAIGVVLLLCATIIAGLALFRAQDEPPVLPPPGPAGPLAAEG